MKTDIELLRELIAIPSVSSDIPEVNRAMERMESYLQEHGVLCCMEEFRGRKVLYASTTKGKVHDYLLNCHLDVVPVKDVSQFNATISGDRMYGRGTDDCKGSAVVIANVLVDLMGKADVGAIFTADEEIGGLTTEYMVKEGYGAKKLIVVIDGPKYTITIAEKGMVNIKLSARGIAAHSSRPWEGENAIEKLLDGYHKIRNIFVNRTPKDADVWFNTYSLDIIKGGSISNMVPESAEMLINVRFTKTGEEKEIAERMREVSGLEVEITDVSVPVFCDENKEELVSLKTIMQRSFPDKEITFSKMCGATDARYFARFSTPVAILGVDGGGCHSEKEWVRLENLDEMAEMLKSYFAKKS